MKQGITRIFVITVAVALIMSSAMAANLNNVLVVGDVAIDIENFFTEPQASEDFVNEILEGQGITSMDDLWYRTEEGDYINVATNEFVSGTDKLVTERIATYYDANALAHVLAISLKEAGTYGPTVGTQTIDKNVIITAADVILQNTIIEGNLLLAESIGEGDVTLKNVTVKGHTSIRGGGPNSIVFENCSLPSITVSKNGVRVVASGNTSVSLVILESGATLVSVSTGTGFEKVTVTEEVPPGTKISLSGNFAEVIVDGEDTDLAIEDGNVETLTLNGATHVSGTGTITTANVNANGSTFKQKPTTIKLADGITVMVGDEEITESTSEPLPPPDIWIPPASDDASLVSLLVNPGTITFDAQTLTYDDVEVPYGTESVEVTFEAAAGATTNKTSPATVTITEGAGTISIVVTAEDEVEEQTYTINFVEGFVEAWLWSDSEYYYIGSDEDIVVQGQLNDATLTLINDGTADLTADVDYTLEFNEDWEIYELTIKDSYLSSKLPLKEATVTLTLHFDEDTDNAHTLTLTITALDPETYYVSKSGDETGDGSFESPFLTIGDALSIVGVGDTISIGEGTFAEDVVIPIGLDFLTIQGSLEGEGTVIDGEITLEFIEGATPDDNEWVSGVSLSDFEVIGSVSIVPETVVDNLTIRGHLFGVHAGGARITNTTVDGDVQINGSETNIEGLDVAGDTYFGGPHISVIDSNFGGFVYGAALDNVQVLSAESTNLIKGQDIPQDAYIAVDVAQWAEGFEAEMQDGRVIRIYLDGVALNTDATWSVVGLEGILDLRVSEFEIELVVEPGQTLAAGTAIVIEAAEGVQMTHDWDQAFVTVERVSTAPWWGYEYRLETALDLADNSGFTVALAEAGDKDAGVDFDLSITDARNARGELLNGDYHVYVNSDREVNDSDGGVHGDAVNFTDGAATVTISLNTGGPHMLHIHVDGISDSETAEVFVVTAALSGLTVSEGELSPQFGPSTTTYTVSVGSTVETIDITATEAVLGSWIYFGEVEKESGVPVTVDLELAGEATVILIRVVAPDGTEKTYSVTVDRAS